MSFTLGRCSVTNDDPETWSSQGNQATFSTTVITTTVAEALAIADQIVGLIENPDEPVVPFTWSENSRADGYYVVTDAHAELLPISLAYGCVAISVSMTRVRSYAIPAIESSVLGAVRANGSSITDAATESYHAIPNAAVDYATDAATASAVVSRTADTGSVDVYIDSAHGGGDFTFLASYSLAPANYYVGAAKIEQGSTLYPVIGRQMPNTPTAWRMGNGLIRISGAASGVVSTQLYTGAAWTTLKPWIVHYTDGSASTVTDWGAVVILRNDPEACTVRLAGVLQSGWAGVPDARVYLDLTVRRGARLIECTITGDDSHKYKFVRSVTEAGTSLTGGIIATAADGDGYKYVLSCADTFTKDLVNGGVNLTSAGFALHFAVGMQFATTSGSEAAEDLVYQYMAATTVSIRVVNR